MKAVGIFVPTIADIGTVIHVWNEDIFDPAISHGLGLLHCLSMAYDHEDHAGSSCNKPLPVDRLDVFNMNFFFGRLFENNDGLFGVRIKSLVVVKWKGR